MTHPYKMRKRDLETAQHKVNVEEAQRDLFTAETWDDNDDLPDGRTFEWWTKRNGEAL